MAASPVLITGGGGQLARALEGEFAARGMAAVRVGRPGFDFDRRGSVAGVLREHTPRLVVNAAAYTGVDAAESDEAAAFRANRDGPAELAAWAEATGRPLLHVSTDYVFDGGKGTPYVESDPVSPQGVYGASKLAGESAVLGSGAPALVLRTSWVYAPSGRNFVLTMLNAGRRTDRLRVVADQVGCPTGAADLAAAIAAIVRRIDQGGWRQAYRGLFHAAGTGSTSWHDFAVAIFEQAARYGRAIPSVEPIATADWPTLARRPLDSRLDCSKLDQVFGVRLPPWRPSLARTIDAILAGSAYTAGG